MPTIKNLQDDKKNVLPKEESTLPRDTVVPPAVPVSTPTIVQAGVSLPKANIPSSSIALPSFLMKDSTPALANDLGSEYLGFADKRSKNWETLQAAGIKEGQSFILKGGSYRGFDELKYILLTGESYLTDVDTAYRFVYASKDITEDNPDPRKRQAHYVCILLVDTAGTFIPIRGDFRGTKSSAVEGAFRAMEAAKKPDWLHQSDTHRATGAFPQPFGRVYHTMTTQRYIGKASGFMSYIAKGTSVPTPVMVMERLFNAFQDADFNKSLEATHALYLKRVEMLDEACTEFKKG